jgi:hypothetical protein
MVGSPKNLRARILIQYVGESHTPRTRGHVIERTHGLNHSDGKTAMSRLGNYSELHYLPVRTVRNTGITVGCRLYSF